MVKSTTRRDTSGSLFLLVYLWQTVLIWVGLLLLQMTLFLEKYSESFIKYFSIK